MPDDEMARPLYNRIAGQSLERIAALSDGIFAVAMTLIVLEIHVPAATGIATEADLLRALGGLGPGLLTYCMSFLTLGIFWTGQQTQLSQFLRADRDLGWIHFGFLAVVAVLPFSTRLLAEFIEFRTALAIYWFSIAVPGRILYASWWHGESAGLSSLAWLKPRLILLFPSKINAAQNFECEQVRENLLSQARGAARDLGRHPAPDRRRPGPLCGKRAARRRASDPEHRRHRADPAQLCGRAAPRLVPPRRIPTGAMIDFAGRFTL